MSALFSYPFFRRALLAGILIALCAALLGKAHIGEVQVSVWDAETKEICSEAGIPLL